MLNSPPSTLETIMKYTGRMEILRLYKNQSIFPSKEKSQHGLSDIIVFSHKPPK
jgi:hypothetical protein